MFRNFCSVLAVLLGGLGLFTSLNAQTITGSIVGSVVDPSELPVSGVSMVLRQVTTGAERQTRTDVRGDFVFSNLVPGGYMLTAEASGFKKIERKDLMLSASETLSAGTLVLAVGSVDEKITVTAQGSVLQTSSSERSGVVTSHQISDLLTKSRNVMSLAQLVPGVVDTDAGSADTLTRSWNIYVQGNRGTENSLTVDGMTLNSWGNANATDLAVSQDSIAEVKVLVGNYQAEYGRRSGGANISLVSKAGSQNFHGMVSYYKRHEEFNANDFFRNRNSQGKARYRYNTWTYNIGGPIYIPNKFNRNKDKLFFFWNQEFWPTESALTGSLTVPTAMERAGDFSQTLDLNKALIPIKDPTTGQPFPGNVVPPSRINASGQSLLNVLPAPNFLDWNISKGAYNYLYTAPVSKPTRMQTLRLDYNINSNNRISGSYYRYINAQNGAANGLDTAEANYPIMNLGYSFLGQAFLGSYTRIISPTFVNELTVGYTRRPQQNTVSQDQLALIQRKQVGFTAGQFMPQNNPLNVIPNVTFGGVPNPAYWYIESRFPFFQTGIVPSLTDTLTKTLGAHTFKAGITVDLLWHRAGAPGLSPFGNFDFSRNTVNPLDSNYAYSNAVLGVFNTYQESNTEPVEHYRERNVEWFAQDSWKATRRLTLEYGIRFCWPTPVWDAKDFLSAFSFAKYDASKQVSLIQPVLVNGVRTGYNPATGATSPAATIGAIASGSGTSWNGMLAVSQNPGSPRGIYEQRAPQLAPRFGFAYDVFGSGKTAVRGGFGVYYNDPGTNVATGFTLEPPLVVTPTLYYGQISTFLSSAGFIFPQAVLGADPKRKIPTVMDISLSVQQKLPYGTVLDVGYSGSLARHLFWSREMDPVPMGRRFDPAYKDPTTGTALSTAFLTPITGYTSILQYEAAGSSNYHSLQVNVSRRFATRLQFGVSWTWSKVMDFVDTDTASVSPLSPRSWDYGLASFDRTHVLKGNAMWDIPGTSWRNPIAKTVLNDWHLSVMPSFVSGAPLGVGFTSTTGIDITGTPSQGARIVVTGNPVLPKSERTFSTNFNTGVFKLPAVGTFGNAAKTLIRGPGINNWDLGLFKVFPIKEFATLQFRWEVYNAPNHTQFSTLNTTARFDANGNQVDASFGQFTATRNPRIMQFGLRLSF